ncbi:hypothetical protein [Luteibaculum oceani]|uniref:SRPBCC family protein n=1 Tax=Luteibaculum oceani TaxID=1294296 RepID=A0A5C6VEX3_9FLAO|nr:hypothetical protein [Luteibaculum oceani]TXC81748.1 hypothetical protein FRX97_04325 [Luteibaculum oceani]
MTTIESKKVALSCTPEEAFKFVTDMNNFEQLLPMERVDAFTSTEDECSFKAQGSFHIGLQKQNTTEFSKIELVSTPKSAIKFNLDVFIDQTADGCEVYQICNAQLNPFLKMMVEKPLNNLFDFIADRMKAIHG